MSASLGKDELLSSIAAPVPSATTSGSNPLETKVVSSTKVYSPSSTEDWVKCPVYAFYRKRWQPKEAVWEPARTLGKAVQAGVNVWLKEMQAGGLVATTVPEVEAAVQAVIEEDFQPQEKYTVVGLTKLATKGAVQVIQSGLFEGHEILMVDEPIGAGRPDVVSRWNGRLHIADFKVSHSLRDDYRAKRLAEYDTHDQFWQYAWEVGNHFGEPVERVRAILVILAPCKVLHADLEVTPYRVEHWLAGAQQKWADMDAESREERPVVPTTSSCYGKYGKCEAYDYCYQFQKDGARAVLSGYYEEKVGG